MESKNSINLRQYFNYLEIKFSGKYSSYTFIRLNIMKYIFCTNITIQKRKKNTITAI